MIWDFFDEIYVLNQAERTDRWKLCMDELNRVGIRNYSQFYSVPADPPMKSFCISQHEILKTIQREGKERVLVLEDDATFENLDYLERAIEQLPSDWDMLYLGCNLRGIKPDPYTPNLRIPHNPWQTHAVAYSLECASYIANHYDPLTEQMYDDWLAHNIHLFKVFLVSPMVSKQNPNFSNIWGCQTDYTETHKQGNELL